MNTIKNASAKMERSVQALAEALAKIRTGRAHTGLLDGVTVSCYGANMPLAQVATVSASETTALVVTVWDKQNVEAVEKAIRAADLGVNPVSAGTNIRVPIPPLSEERRQEVVKMVGKEAEETKISLRNTRRDGLAEIKNAVKNKEIGEDEGNRLEREVENLLSRVSKRVDEMVADKRKDLMTI